MIQMLLFLGWCIYGVFIFDICKARYHMNNKEKAWPTVKLTPCTILMNDDEASEFDDCFGEYLKLRSWNWLLQENGKSTVSEFWSWTNVQHSIITCLV